MKTVTQVMTFLQAVVSVQSAPETASDQASNQALLPRGQTTNLLAIQAKANAVEMLVVVAGVQYSQMESQE